MSAPIIDLKNAIIYIRDAGTSFIAVRVGEGNLTYAEKRNVISALSRGTLDRIRLGDQVPIDLHFQFVWDNITSHDGDTPSIEDALKKRGEAADWLTTNPDKDSPYSVDIVIVSTPECPAFNETLYFSQFNFSELSHDIKNATVDCSGICNYFEAITP